MKQYPTYKESGVQWIGLIPEHWEAYPIKWYLQLCKGNKPAELAESGEEPYVTMDYIRNRENKVCMYPANTDGLVHIEDNDILILWDGANAGEVVFGRKGYLSSTMALCSFDNKVANKEYGYYFLKSLEPIFKQYAGGTTIPHFDSSVLFEYNYPLPSLSEQQTIAQFLDSKTAKIDESVLLYEQQKADLVEYRKALISDTVTRGLNPNVPLKDSGIQWLGQIPEGWKIVPLKFLLASGMMYGANESADEPNMEWPRYIRITDIAENGSLKDETYMSLFPDKAADYMLQKGDILFARSGATVGKTYMFNENYPACFAGYLIRATCGKDLLPEFLLKYTQSSVYENWKNSIYIQSTIQNIGADKYNQMPIPVPSLAEQQAIVSFLDSKTAMIDEAIRRIDEQIADLKAYRTALITDAVTGKIDVR